MGIHPTHKSLIAFGAPPGESSAGLAVSFAALVGVLAGIPVAVLDLDPQAEISRQILGIREPKGIEWLVDSLLQYEQFTVRQVQDQLVWHAAADYSSRGFYVLPGAQYFSLQHQDRTAGARGQRLAESLLHAAGQLEHRYVIINVGSNIRSLLGEKIFAKVQLGVLVSANRDQAVQWARTRFRYVLAENWMVTPSGDSPYPVQGYAWTLTQPYSANPFNASQIAITIAEYLYPEINSMLVDETGKRIKPWRGTWSDRIFRGG